MYADMQKKEANKTEKTGIKTALSFPLSEYGCLKHNKNKVC